MERAMYPCKNIRITQRDHEGTHADCWATDEAGYDGGIDSIIAPFTGVIRKIFSQELITAADSNNNANILFFIFLSPWIYEFVLYVLHLYILHLSVRQH